MTESVTPGPPPDPAASAAAVELTREELDALWQVVLGVAWRGDRVRAAARLLDKLEAARAQLGPAPPGGPT